MTAPMRLRSLHARPARGSWSKPTGSVQLYGIATWLKREPLVDALLTPKEARKLAVLLLTAADTAEADQ